MVASSTGSQLLFPDASVCSCGRRRRPKLYLPPRKLPTSSRSLPPLRHSSTTRASSSPTSTSSSAPASQGVYRGPVPRRSLVAGWVSNNDGIARSLPIYVGGVALLAVLLNRAFSGIAPVADASSSQSRADILSLALAVTDILAGLVWLSIRPKYISPEVPQGVDCRRIYPGLPDSAVRELLWSWTSISDATCCRSLVIIYKDCCLLQIGIASESSKGRNPMEVDIPNLIQGSLYQNAIQSGKQSYLANLSLYPGRADLPFLPPNTQALILQPIGAKGIAIIGGHGTLPPSRLPSVTKELLQFLLEDSSALASPVIKSIKSSCGVCPNLCYLLWLDTESTLEVMRCAFSNDTFTKLNNSSEYSTETHMEEKIDTVQNPEDQNVLVQIILSSLIVILDMESNVIRSFQVEENGIVENWPSKRDIGHVIEFIAYFITCKRATASGKVLKHILEYLTSDVSPSVGPSQRNEASQREKQVLSLLKVVPQMDWDLSCVLDQCLEAHFHQACGLIHTIRGQHIAALDSYMKDFNEPFYAFAFVFDMLLKLNDSESSTFRSAVMSRIPELAKLSREDTFLLVIDQFNKESQQIMSELQSHPRSLFLFLKTIIDVHLHGTLNFPILGDSQNSDVLLRRMKDGYTELGTYLDRISSFTKLLQQNPFNVDDKTAELYLELLCQYECGSVLRFLETFENYRLEHCLRLCQEYGVNDAAAFLLERVGDVGSALELLMAGLDEKFVLLATAVEQALPKTSSRTLCSMELLNTSLKMDEVSSVHGILHSAIGLCQRNTQRLDPLESELLWFRLLDLYCEPLRELYDDKEISLDLKIRSMLKQRFRELNRGAGILRCIFSHFIKEIVEGMVGHVPLPAIMGKLLADNGGQEFGDFKFTLLGLLGTYGYERRILGTAKSLIEDDTFYTLSLLRKGASHAYAPQSLVCCLCGSSLAKVSSSSSIRVFNCGHATHLHCEPQENGVLGRDSSAGCPVCMPKRKPLPPRGKSILMENRLIRNSLSQTTKGVSSVYHLHEPDAIERPHGNPQMSRFEMLNNLQETRKVLQVDPLPQLRLAPPSIYHEKVQKGTDVLQREDSNPQRTEKPNKSRQIWDSKSKGFSKRFPLKTNIFGKERSASR